MAKIAFKKIFLYRGLLLVQRFHNNGDYNLTYIVVCYGCGWFWSNCFFIFVLVVFSFLLHFSISNKSICHCISSLLLRFKNLLYFSLLLLPHSVSFCLLILVLPLIFSRVQSVYIYILYILYTYMLFIFWIVFSHP